MKTANEVIQIETMKGRQCLYKPIICQEGWCTGCQIYLDRNSNEDKVIADNMRDYWMHKADGAE